MGSTAVIRRLVDSNPVEINETKRNQLLNSKFHVFVVQQILTFVCPSLGGLHQLYSIHFGVLVLTLIIFLLRFAKGGLSPSDEEDLRDKGASEKALG